MSEKKDPADSPFGKISPVGSRILSGHLVLKLFSAGLMGVVLAGSFLRMSGLGIERTLPVISLSASSSTLSRAAVGFDVTVTDEGSGLRHIGGFVRQGDTIVPLFDRSLDRLRSYRESLSLDLTKLKLGQGPAELLIHATDDSVWANAAVFVRPLLIDDVNPVLELVSLSPHVTSGGTALLFYRASDANLGKHGVRVGDMFFPGVPAAVLDSAFRSTALFASFFTTVGTERPHLQAMDVAGNEALMLLPIKQSPREGSRQVQITIPKSSFFLERARALFAQEYGEGEIFEGERTSALLKRANAGDRAADVAIVGILQDRGRTEGVRQHYELVRSGGSESRRWEAAPRLNLMGVRASFGDSLTLADTAGTLWSGDSKAVFFEPFGPSTVVSAPFAGIVRYADDFGVYGKSVILDHGVGISSMYFGLIDISVEPGVLIEQGRPLGRMGNTGLTWATLLGAMVFIHGVPVDPREWLDVQLYRSVIETPLNQAMDKLGIVRPTSLTRAH